MSGFEELKQHFHVLTPLGKATVWAVEIELDSVLFYCWQNETGEHWVWNHQHVRLDPSITDRRARTTPIELSADLEKYLEPHRERISKWRNAH